MSNRSYIVELDVTAPGETSAEREITQDMCAIFGVLSDPTRLRILLALRAGERCVADLVEIVAVSQSAVSHQLRLLRDLKLVTYRREGRSVLYRLADGHVVALVDVAAEHARELGGGGGE